MKETLEHIAGHARARKPAGRSSSATGQENDGDPALLANSASRRVPGLSNVVQKQLTRRNSLIRRQVEDACGTSRAAIA